MKYIMTVNRGTKLGGRGEGKKKRAQILCIESSRERREISSRGRGRNISRTCRDLGPELGGTAPMCYVGDSIGDS